jgi:hypothetical protein
VFEAVFTSEARADRARLGPDEREEVNSIVARLEQQPRSNDETQFTVDMPEWTAGVYDDGRWEIVYRILDDRFIEVVGIRRIAG